MPHVVISNVIGTVMLIVILGLVTFIGTTLTLQFSAQTVQSGLQEVASYVSSQMVSMMSLVDSSPPGNVSAFKLLELPSALGNYGYYIELSNAQFSPTDTLGWKVVAFLNSNNRVMEEAPLNIQSGINILLTGNITFTSAGGVNVAANKLIQSGQGGASRSQSAVIFIQSIGGQVYLGLGITGPPWSWGS